MKEQDKDAAELAWKMFEKTGNVSYYMLYQRLHGRN
ncbi:MAG: YqzL family protein [Clostridia bacterium]|nr:YqzL family protein [Clostridia bacterium]MDE7181948.1 YqzL family protein [Clostridia bacterium]